MVPTRTSDSRFTSISKGPDTRPAFRSHARRERMSGPSYFMAVDTLPNVALTCDPRPFTAAIIATAIPAAMRPYSMRMPLAAAVRAIQHCAVETDERGGCNGLLYLSIGRTSGFICAATPRAMSCLVFPSKAPVGFITARYSSHSGFSAWSGSVCFIHSGAS